MLVLLKATYPPSSVKKAIEVFMSPETPKRSAASKEIASFAYGDYEGYHSLFILDVEDAKFAEFMNAQTSRSAYMQSRIDGSLGHPAGPDIASRVGDCLSARSGSLD